VYFHLPAGTNFYAAKPQANIPIPSAPIVYTSNVTLIVGIRHANGDGAEGRRGDDFLATYQLDGSIVGEVTIDPGAEYEMYRRAFEISAAFSSGSRPAPSAVYELLRFGRVVNTDNEHLAPADCPHWRYVSYANGKGWVNLNAYGITKYSDADFPHWKFWSIIDDDIDGDSRANSTLVNRLIGGASDPLHVTLVRQLDTPLMRQKLSRAICKFPSEWNRDTVDRRWGWLQTNADYQLIGEDWIRFRTHVEALAVPATLLPEALRAEHWHFHPSTFVTHFRMCQWLSASEFRQLVPKHAMRRHSGVTLWESVETNLTGVSSVAVVQRRGLNRMARKYGITSPLRLASFYGNAVQETNWLGRLSEAGGATLWYAPWYGRGFLQLTHPENYIDYWRYRGRLIPDALRAALQSAKAGIANQPATQRNNATLQDELFPQLTQQIIGWRDEVRGVAVAGSSDAAYAPADTAGFYWAKLRMAAHADSEHVLQRVVATTAQGPKVYYRSASFWRASAAVNFPLATNTLYAPGLNGFDARCVAYDYALAVLTEMYFPSDEGMPSLDFPEGYSPRRDQ
jgi:predicted chitinase